jgi:hypothetical protein
MSYTWNEFLLFSNDLLLFRQNTTQYILLCSASNCQNWRYVGVSLWL